MLIAFRVLQGLGGGMLMPLGMTIMTRAAGPHRMGRLMAILGIPMLLGPIMGPILGGWLIEHASWHWIFLINLPLGVGAMVYAWFVLEKDAPQPSESFDFLGMALMSPGSRAVPLRRLVDPRAANGDYGYTRVWVTAITGVLLVVAFVFHSFRPEHPLLDLRLFKNRNLTVSIITMFMFVAAFFGGLLLVPTYFQQVRGESALVAGLLVAPQGIGAMVTMPIAGTLSRPAAGRPDRARRAGGHHHRHVRPDPGHRDHAVPLLIAVLFVHGSRHGRHDDAVCSPRR